MGDLSRNLSRSEVACQCGCGFDTIDHQTVRLAQEVCDHFAQRLGVERVRLTVTSGSRCAEHNRAIGGSPNSQHLRGRALDIVVHGVSPSDVHAYLVTKYPGRFGFGSYTNFTHIDSRNTAARW